MYDPNYMYNISFVAHTNVEIMNRSFKYVIITNNPDNTIDILLCSEYSRYLTLEDHDKKKTYKLCKYTWPVFI